MREIDRSRRFGRMAAGAFSGAGRRAYQAGYVHDLRRQADEVLACAGRAVAHWVAGAGGREQVAAIRLRGAGHRLNQNLPAAIEAFSQAASLVRAVDPESADVSICLTDLAGVEHVTGDFAAAERGYREALRIANKANYRDGIAYITGNLVELALDRKDWPAAERLARDALSLTESIGRQELIGADCARLAAALARQGKPADGLPHAQCAVEIFSRLRTPDGLKRAQAMLLECAQAVLSPADSGA